MGADGHLLVKADPVARRTEAPPATASVVADPLPFRWSDAAWMETRAARQRPDAPIAIYEVHAGSWLRDVEDGGRSLDWDALGERLIPYVAGLGFTHVELLPVAEHPFGGSWGYQPLGLFAPSARFGPPEAFARFVERCHQAALGVIVDWVPAHFPSDPHGLARFDGTALYEHADPREGFHQDWNTLIYNFGRHEVRGFLIASALEWLEHFHIDGLRVDAVASMLYRDYSRPADAWVPNRYGGRENLEAVAFLQQMNAVVHARCPGAITIAEESTAWPGVTAAVEVNGLGFDYKWNMGWMHDTLHYMQRDPIYRQHHHDGLTFGLVYAFSERFILPLSHDEVVHGKGSLLGKMPGDDWQRLANLRAYLAFMWTHPGKKLLFMGGEFGQARRVEPRCRAGMAPAGRPAAPRRAAAGARPERPLPQRTGPARARLRARRLQLGDRRRPRQQRLRLPAARHRGHADADRGQHDPGAARRLPDRRAGCRWRGAVARNAQYRQCGVWRDQSWEWRCCGCRGCGVARVAAVGGGAVAAVGCCGVEGLNLVMGVDLFVAGMGWFFCWWSIPGFIPCRG